MKSLRSIGISAILFSLCLFIFSCGGNSQGHDHGDGEHTHEQTDHSHEGAAHGEGKAYTAAYVCPMHCEGSGSDSEGKCPVCNMDYVAQAEHTKDGHSH